MFYENELRFLCDTLKKSHVQASTVTPNELLSTVFDTDLGFFKMRHEAAEVHRFFGSSQPRTVYKFTDAYGRCFVYLLLPDVKKTTLLFIGPYLASAMSSRQILEMTEKNGISPKIQRYFEEYYASLPVLTEKSFVFVMLDTFCERIWESPSFTIVDLGREQPQPASLINETAGDDVSDIIANMKTMEKRYEFENELMRAVSLGQLHKEKRLLTTFSDASFEKRAADPLRNAKNYCVIMNTLLRKAAEKGGVHPVYLDRMSSDFAAEIEQFPSLSGIGDLMGEMFRSYCRLVRKHSMKSYSLLVQKTILIIDSDLSADLSLSSLAADQNVSAGYLSTVFKRDTGKTVSEYIRDKRVEHAIHLLSTTHLQIQTVALHCGIMDVQYFSKIFKKHTGKTPKEYRESLK